MTDIFGLAKDQKIPLGEGLALVLRSAREGAGYSIAEHDRAVAQALLLEAMQRIAMLAGSSQRAHQHDAILEILDAILGDIRQEATKMMASRLN